MNETICLKIMVFSFYKTPKYQYSYEYSSWLQFQKKYSEILSTHISCHRQNIIRFLGLTNIVVTKATTYFYLNMKIINSQTETTYIEKL